MKKLTSTINTIRWTLFVFVIIALGLDMWNTSVGLFKDRHEPEEEAEEMNLILRQFARGGAVTTFFGGFLLYGGIYLAANLLTPTKESYFMIVIVILHLLQIIAHWNGVCTWQKKKLIMINNSDPTTQTRWQDKHILNLGCGIFPSGKLGLFLIYFLSGLWSLWFTIPILGGIYKFGDKKTRKMIKSQFWGIVVLIIVFAIIASLCLTFMT